MDDEEADAGEEEGEVRHRAPLPGRDPHLGSRGEQGHDADVGGIEEVLAAPPDDELAADRDRRREPRENRRAGAQEQAEREPGDQRALGVEAGEAEEARAGELREQGARKEQRDAPRTDVEAQAGDSPGEQQGQRGDLEISRISRSHRSPPRSP